MRMIVNLVGSAARAYAIPISPERSSGPSETALSRGLRGPSALLALDLRTRIGGLRRPRPRSGPGPLRPLLSPTCHQSRRRGAGLLGDDVRAPYSAAPQAALSPRSAS